MTEPERRPRSTTGDLLHLVEELSNFDRIGVTRLARQLGVPVPTAYRMLRALERAGYVEQLAGSKEYRLTLKLFELGSRVASRTTLRDLASVEVERLAQQGRAGRQREHARRRGRPVPVPGPGQDRGTAGGEPDAGQPGPGHLHRDGQGHARGGVPRRAGHRRAGALPAPHRALHHHVRGAGRRARRDPAGRLRRRPAGAQPRRVVRGRADPRGQADPARRGERLGVPPPSRRGRGGAPGQAGHRGRQPHRRPPRRPRQHGLLVAPDGAPGPSLPRGAYGIAESRTERPERIILFAKFPSCLIGHGDPIRYPATTAELDYEGELAVVIGRQARHVPADQALDYVGGYTIINDVSARDLQGAEPQWIRGKALDTFAPLGPVLLDAAAAPPVADMRLRTLVNGEVRQDASCAQMITGVPELIAYISDGITLEPGDIIATGTPSGVALGMNPPRYLQPGDKVSIEITAIGELVNPVSPGTP